MKNLSKVLAVVLAFAMALSMVSFAAYTDVAETDNCAEAVSVLSALEILKGYEDGSFKPEATITRAEFATVVIRLLGLADTATGGSTIFTDVAADHWANGAIALAAQQGIVNGYGDGKFGPEDPVKYQEAIKMVVAALGYTPMADANGGYPGGYQVVASQKGILSGISGAKADEPASRGVVAQLAYNSLTVPLMEQTGYGTQTNFQTVNMLLLNKLGVTKFEGVVTATSLSSNLKDGKIKVTYNYQVTAEAGKTNAVKYSYDEETGKGSTNCNPYMSDMTEVQIAATGDVEAAAKDLIDVASVMYVKSAETDDAELVCIIKDGKKNETMSFMSEDLRADADIDEDGTGVIEVYTDADAGEYEEYTINVNKVYVNGRTTSVEAACGVAEKANIDDVDEMATVLNYYLDNNKAVDVTFLSQEEDEWNVAYITSYVDVKVNRIAERTAKVYGDIIPSGSEIVRLDETDDKLKFEIYKDGEPATFADIAVNDIISIAGYIDSSLDDGLAYGKVYITSEQVEGKVTAKSASAEKITVDGTTYKAKGTALDANLGDTAVFYVNARGVLVARDTKASAATVQYGFASYIRKYDADYNDPAQIRLLTTAGQWQTLNLAKMVDLNNGGRTDTRTSSLDWATVEAGDDTLDLLTGTKYGINNLVAYDLNADGEVSKLYMVDVENTFKKESISAGNKTYDAGTMMFSTIFMDEETVIFSVDASEGILGDTSYNLEDEDLVSVVSLSSIADRAEHMIVAGYDYDDDSVIGALVGREIAAGINYGDNFFVIADDPMQSTNEAGEVGLLLTGIQAGETKTVFINTEEGNVDVKKVAYVDETASLKDQLGSALTIDGNSPDFEFEKGDIILYTLDAKGEADVINVLVDASDVITDGTYGSLDDSIDGTAGDTTVATVNVGTTEYKFVFGYAKQFLTNKITLKGTSAEATYSFAPSAIGTEVDLFTGLTGRIREAASGDIEVDSNYEELENDGDMVFARATGSRIDEFVVFANSND